MGRFDYRSKPRSNQTNFLGRRGNNSAAAPAANASVSNQAMADALQRERQRQGGEWQRRTPTDEPRLHADIFLKRMGVSLPPTQTETPPVTETQTETPPVTETQTETPPVTETQTETPPVTETQTPASAKARRGHVKAGDAPEKLREKLRNDRNAQTLSQLNAPGTQRNFQDMSDPESLGDAPLYADLKSVLADIARIRSGNYPEHIKNRMLSAAYETAAQSAGLLDLGGIDDDAQSELVKRIRQQAEANAAIARETQNPVKLRAQQREGATSGGLNAVGIYRLPGAKDSQGNDNEKKFFKKEIVVDSEYRKRNTAATNTELQELLPHLGINAGQKEEKVDRHMRDREIAYSLLNDYLGAGVSVGAREAQDENANTGALLDEAKGMAADEYGWRYLAPLDPEKATADEHNQALSLTDSAVTDNGVVDKSKTSKYGDRLKKANKELVSTSYNVARKGKDGKALTDESGKPIFAPTLDVANPQFHRDMNRMQILDSLTGHIDRHGNNFKIETDERGNYKSLKAIDNDMSFGRQQHAFGERFHNSPGMPDATFIDQELAERVKATPKQDLQYLFQGMFSDDPTESEEVIDNLWNNMQGFNEYAERNQAFQVRDWTEEHAKQELLSATGTLANANGTKSHNTLYQRLMMTRIAKDPRLKASKFLKTIAADEKAY